MKRVSSNIIKDIPVEFYDKKEEVFEKFIKGEVASFTLSAIHYLKNKEKLDSSTQDLYAFVANQDEYISYVIVTKKSNKIKTIKDLKNCTLGVHKNHDMEILYLDHTLLRHKLSSHQKYLSKLKVYDNHSRVLMKLFFNKLDACIVPITVWEMMTEMNPQLSKKLKILDKSPNIFMSMLSLISKNMSDEMSKIHLENTLSLSTSAKGKQIYTLLRCNGYMAVGKFYIQPMNEYYQEYLRLKK